MPRNLIFLLSRRCSLGCPDCNIHPELDDGAIMSPETLEENIGPKARNQIGGGIIWTGGEPFETPEILLQGLRLAASRGFQSEILTGAHWTIGIDSILRALEPFRDSMNLRVSVDGAHLSRIGPDRVLELCTRIMERKFRVSFTIRSHDPFSGPELTGLLQQLTRLVQRLDPKRAAAPHLWHQIPHMKAPAPLQKIRHEPLLKPSASRRCRLALVDRVIAWDGLSYACCGLFLFRDNSGLSLSHKSNRAVFEELRRIGPAGVARRLGLRLPDSFPDDGSSPCTLCQILWKNHSALLQSSF